MKRSVVIFSFLFFLLLLQDSTLGGPIAYGICQSGCAAIVVACYAAAGFTFGTVTAGAGTPAAIIACNSAFGICSGKCALVGFTPTP